jgi:hypothetical protein
LSEKVITILKKYCDQKNAPKESQTNFLFFEAGFLWRVYRQVPLIIALLEFSTKNP